MRKSSLLLCRMLAAVPAFVIGGGISVAAADPPPSMWFGGTGIDGLAMQGCVELRAGMAGWTPDFVEAPDQWTQRRVTPRDCAFVNTATPVFAWSEPANKGTNPNNPWTFVLRDDGNTVLETVQTNSPRVLLSELPSARQLATGKYNWYVSYTDQYASTHTSDVRRFEVVAGANTALLPSSEQVISQASGKAHPRLLPETVTHGHPTSFADIKALANISELSTSFQAFEARANAAAGQPPRQDPDTPGAPGFPPINGVTHHAEEERRDIEALAYFGRFNNSQTYTDKAVERLVALAAWSPDGMTSEINQDQANREVYLALAEGLDLVGDQLARSQRNLVISSLRERIRQVRDLRFKRMDVWPYDSHVVTSTGFVVEALLYVVEPTPAVGEVDPFPEAKAWLKEAYELWMVNQDIWGGADGGWANSTAYGWFQLNSLPRQLGALKLVTGYDLAAWRPIAKLGDQYMAMTPPVNGLRSPFGDGVETLTLYGDLAFDGYRMLAGLTRDPVQEWYWRQLGSNIATPYPLPPAHYMLLAINPTRVPAVAPTQNSLVFEDAGLVAIHSSTADPARSSVYFRSSSMGSFSHSHADNNAFTFVSRGKDLLISAGYYDYYGSDHHLNVTRATRYKNAMTFDGGIGQAEPLSAPVAPGAPVSAVEARGRLVNYYDTGTWAFSTGDAALAYRGRVALEWTPLLSNAVRTVAYNRVKKVLVVYDWAQSSQDRIWELNFQSLSAPTRVNQDGSPNPSTGRTIKVVNGSASACIDVYGLDGSTGPGNVELGAINLYTTPPPIDSHLPNHYRSVYTASPTKKNKELVAVTVIREDCSAVSASVSFSSGTGEGVALAIIHLDSDWEHPIALYRNTVSVPAP